MKKYELEILQKYYEPKSRLWAEFAMDSFAQWRHCLNMVDKNGGSILNIDYGYTHDKFPKSVTLRVWHFTLPFLSLIFILFC